MVVHRKPEQDGEQEQRYPQVYDVGLLEAEQIGPQALLEHHHQQPVGRSHGEQVHNDGLDRNDQRPEDHHQEDEAEAQHEGEDDGRVGVHDVLEVGGGCGQAAHQRLRRNPAESRRDMLVADGVHGGDGRGTAGLPGYHHGEYGEVGLREGLHLRRQREPGIGLYGRRQLPDGFLDLGAAHVAVNDYIGGIDHAEGKFLLQDEEGVAGEGAFRVDVNAVDPGVYLEEEDRGGNHRAAHCQQAEQREPGHGAGYGVPHSAPGITGGIGAGNGPADERQAQGVDSRPQQRQHGRQQGEGGRQRNEDDDYCAEAKRLEEGRRDYQHTAQGEDHGEAAEQHRAPGGGPGLGNGVADALSPSQLLAVAGNNQQGVVNPDSQANHGNHQGDEEGQLESLPHQGRNPQGHADGNDGQPDGQGGCHCAAEYNQQDD